MTQLRPTPMELLSNLEKVTGKEYSDSQKDAILHPSGPLWITAGPGSGKTEVLVGRALRLILCENVPPGSIILTTFTERAAANLTHRIASYLDELGFAEVDTTDLWAGTLHSLCNRIMRDYRFAEFRDLELLDEVGRSFFLIEQKDILDDLKSQWKSFPELFGGGVSPAYGPNRWAQVSAAGFIFDRLTEFMVDIDKMASSKLAKARFLAILYRTYRERLRNNYRCDLSVLQEYFLHFLASHTGAEFLRGNPAKGRPPVSQILVDEYQDTNPIQEAIYFELARDAPHNLAVVGDDDQALYRFRGGTVDSLVDFGANAHTRWMADPHRVNLLENYRSHRAIVEWVNDYVGSFAVMKKHGARAPDKKRLIPKSDVSGDYPAVCMISGDGATEVANKAAEFLLAIRSQGLISDWRDVGVLLHSTKETRGNARPYVEAFESRGIPVYNPRNRSLHRDPLVAQLLGALTVTLDRERKVFDGKYQGGKNNEIKGRARSTVEFWLAAYKALAASKEGAALAKYVARSHRAISKKKYDELLNTTVMDVLYRILSFEPFSSALKDPNHATQLATITGLVDAFTVYREGRGLLRASTRIPGGGLSTQLLTAYYYQFAGFIEASGLNDPEDPEDLMPSGYVQMMTVHQAKGLEFPIVLAGSLGNEPRVGRDHWTEDFLAPWSPRKPHGTSKDRAAQDLVRKFYVAFSRPKNALVLCASDSDGNKWGLGR